MKDFKPIVLLNRLRTSLWAVPAAIVFAATSAGVVLVELEGRAPDSLLDQWPALFGAGADGSRAMLTAIAGSMITVAGVVFSITLVALSLASTQYSPRVLRNFLGDRANQMVLGVFVGIFAYCLVVLRSIRSTDEGAFVPAMAVLFGIVLAFVGIGFLIYFIHHVATSIQATSIMERIAAEAIQCVGQHQIEDDDESRRNESVPRDTGRWRTACASRHGYVARIDYGELNRLAEEQGGHIRVERGVGEFAIEGQPLVSMRPGSHPQAGEEDVSCAMAAAFEISRQRTAEFDPAFGVRQLVDVALKSLSSGANDPTTASTAIDYLTAVLVHVTARATQAGDGDEPDPYPRVQRRAPTFSDLLRMSYGEIRQAANGNMAALEAIARSIDTLDRVTTRPARRRVLRAQAEALLVSLQDAYLPPCDVHDLQVRIVERIASLSISANLPASGSAKLYGG